jgi:hypothetical protein
MEWATGERCYIALFAKLKTLVVIDVEHIMKLPCMSELVSAAAADASALMALRKDPAAFSQRFGLTASETDALRTADTLSELDRNPLGRSAITLTGGVTKTQRKSHLEFDSLAHVRDLDRLTKRDLIRLLKLSLMDRRFAKKLQAELKI